MYSIVDLAGTGGQSNFAFSFGYLDQDHIHVYIDGEATTEFTFSSAFVITLDTPLAGTATVRIQRLTPIDEPVVDFVNGSVLGETDLDFADLQILYSQQEIADAFGGTIQLNADGLWDAEGIRIINVGAPVDGTDAATVEYVNSVLNTSPSAHALEAHTNVDTGIVHAKGQLLAWDSIQNLWVAVPPGTDGQLLQADSGEDKGISWSNGILALITAAGDLLQGTSNGVAERLAATTRGAFLVLNSSVKAAWKAVGSKGTILSSDGTDPQWQAAGTNGYVLVADSGENNGIKWQAPEVTGFTTGDAKITFKTTADLGWVFANDGSIGNASSSATTRANADCENLFLLMWTNFADAECPVSGGRGGSAAADWAANKRITLPKTLGRALGCYGAGSGLTSRALGKTVGSEDAINVTHNHGVTDPGHTHGVVDLSALFGGTAARYSTPDTGSEWATVADVSNTTGISINNSGSSGTGANMPPTSFLNLMVKL